LSGRIRDAALALATCGAVVVLDQASKAVVRDNIARGDTVEVLPFLDFANTRNKGVAFGLAGDVSPLVIGGTLVVLLALLGYMAARAGSGWAVWLPAGLLIGGALGNLADRVRDGSVTDFIDFPVWATFNVADIAIVVGVVLLVLLSGREPKPP
jgi:signal peptidase II